MLGSNGTPLQRVYWSPLYLAAEESFVSRSGLLNFFHDFLRKAVEDRYLYDSDKKRAAHLRIANYFEKRELDDRKVDELPWHLREAEGWQRLKDCITDIGMFPRLSAETKQYELVGYWLSIGNRFDMVQAYASMLDEFESTSPSEVYLADILNQVFIFFSLNARYAEAEPFYRRALEIREKVLGREHPDVATALNNLAVLYRGQGRYADAEPFYRRSLEIREKVLGREHPHVAQSLNNLALLYHDQGRYADAEPLYKRAVKIAEEKLGAQHPNTELCKKNLKACQDAMGSK